MKALLLLYMGTIAALASRSAGAGPWSVEPRLGIAADSISNPLLHATAVRAEENIAASVDLPLRYDTDAMEFMLRPSARRANRQGYSSLASNYEHLDAAAQVNSDLSATTLQGELARDSSLYYVGGLVNGIGVPRDSANTSVDWTRSFTERQQLQLDASWARVRYVAPTSFNALVDYRYVSAGPTFSVAVTERDTLKVLGSYGLYQSLNGITESRSENLQMAFVRRLTEIWSLSLSAGYSRSVNSEKIFANYFSRAFFLGDIKSSQNGAVYAATLTRQGERFNVSVGATQALQPTGFAFLSRQNGVNLNATYIRTDRWDFTATALWLRAINPTVGAGGTVNRTESTTRYWNTQLSANWHSTPECTISVSAARITQQYGPPTLSAASTNISVNLVRQFLRTQF